MVSALFYLTRAVLFRSVQNSCEQAVRFCKCIQEYYPITMLNASMLYASTQHGTCALLHTYFCPHCFLSCRVHWSGTETATVWCGFMNGAVQAGTRSAHEVLRRIYPDFVTPEEHSLEACQNVKENSNSNYWKMGILSTIVLALSAFLGLILWK